MTSLRLDINLLVSSSMICIIFILRQNKSSKCVIYSMWSFISLVMNWSWVTFAFIANGHQRNNRFDRFFFWFYFQSQVIPYLWQCILSGGTRNDDKNLHIPKTCSRSIIYNNSLMQWLMSIMRFCICLNVLVHRQYSSLQTFHLTEPCALHRAVHMLHAHNRYSLACLSLLFISIAFSFVIRDIQKSLYTAMTAYMSKALIMAFVLFLYIDFLHMFMLLFYFNLIQSFPNWRVVRC